MRKRRIYFALLILAVAAVVGLIVIFPPRRELESEPEYEGKKLSEWLQKYGETNSAFGWVQQAGMRTGIPMIRYPLPPLDGEAQVAIQHIGTNAIPFLLDWIRQGPWARKSPLRDLTEVVLDLFKQTPGRDVREARRYYGVAGAFWSLGPAAAGAIPELQRILKDTNAPWSGARAADALAFIGKDALPVLVEAVTNREAGYVRGLVIQSIASMGTNARPVIPLLVECLTDADVVVASTAGLSLGCLRLEPDVVIPALIEKLQDNRKSTQGVVAQALIGFGHEAHAAVPVFLKMLENGDSYIRETATNALRKIDPEALEKAGK